MGSETSWTVAGKPDVFLGEGEFLRYVSTFLLDWADAVDGIDNRAWLVSQLELAESFGRLFGMSLPASAKVIFEDLLIAKLIAKAGELP